MSRFGSDVFMAGAVLALLVLPAPGSLVRADPLAAMESHQQKLFDRTAPSVVFLSRDGAFGSGFFVQEFLLLTNAHVVGTHKTVEVVFHDGRRVKGKVVERAAGDVDLALVEVAEKGIPVTLVRESDLRVGSWVASVGHGMGGIWTFTTGMVSNIYPLGTDRPVFQTQIPLNPGNSGGPILDRHGRAVGVVTAGIEKSNSINFAIRSDVAYQVLSRLSEQCDCLTVLAPDGVPVFVDGKMAGKGPRVVLSAQRRAYEVFAVVGGKMNRKSVTWPAQRTVDLRN